MCLERVSGTTWNALIEERIFRPLGMTASDTSVTAALKNPGLAGGYAWDADEKKLVHQPMRNVDAVAPAGAINSNVRDMVRWVQVQLGRGELGGARLLSRQQQAETWTKHVTVQGDVDYGLGWFLRTWEGHRVIEHAGGIDGFTAEIALLPDDGVGFVLLMNLFASPLQETSREIVFGTLLGEWSEETPAAPEDFQPYLGTYIGNFGQFKDAEFKVLVQGGNLAVDVPGQMVFELKPPDAEGRRAFALTDQIAVRFNRAEDGSAPSLAIFQNGYTFELLRRGTEAPVEIDLEAARRLAGTYRDEGLGDLSVLIRNNRLAVDIPGQMVYELYPPDARTSASSPGSRSPARRSSRSRREPIIDPMLAAFSLTAFAGALLLFLVQPMVGKMLLPRLGGSPAVWNTCMLFFQAALLAGYAWAHLLARIPRQGAQIALHGALLAVAAVALASGMAAGGDPPAEGSPAAWMLLTLARTIGLPFVAVAATAPLIQKWFAGTDDRRAADPYFLYAASNAGSLLGLLAYPLLVETLFDIGRQQAMWSAGFAVLAVLIVACGVMALRRRAAAIGTEGDSPLRGQPPRAASPREPAAAPAPASYFKYALLAFVPSSLMLAVTQHITTDVAAVPLLWVVPLAIYLLTCIFAFARHQLVGPLPWSRLLTATTIGVLAIAPTWNHIPVSVSLGMNLLLLFFGAMVCHGRLAAARPGASHLTGYYLAMAAGGACGGVFNALIAPQIFDGVFEYPLAIAAAFLLRDRASLGAARVRAVRWVNLGLDTVVVGLAAVAIPWMMSLPDMKVLAAGRTFFGVHRVAVDREGAWHTFFHGHILHNVQSLEHPRRPLAYFSALSGIGQVYLRLAGDPRLNSVGIVGLGAGAMSAWAQPGQEYTFFEIDPAIVRMASNRDYFTFLSDMPVEPRIVLGDGRLSLAREPDGRFGLFVVDAFSSDSIPVHMLTAEAIDLYFRKLEPRGLLALHVTNRYLDLTPLVRGLARERGLSVARWREEARVLEDDEGVKPSRWLILARGREPLERLLADPAWELLAPEPGDPVWTDRSSNLLAVLDWWQ
jgi:hypothetical protein